MRRKNRMKRRGSLLRVLAWMALGASVSAALAQSPQGFELIAKYRGVGGLVASTIAPGAAPGSERLYASFLYDENTIDVISVDPMTGATRVFHSPIRGDFGARNIAVGPDGNVYLGTLPHAHFLKLDRRAGKLIDLGQPSPGEQYIWDVTFGSDQKLYGVTYPGCKLVRYDPGTGQLADLGRMDPTEAYGRWIVGDSDGLLYIGIGTTKANIAVYDTRTGEHHEILPADAQTVGTARVYRGADGNIYGSIGTHVFRLKDGAAEELKDVRTPPAAAPMRLRDGSVVSLADNANLITVSDPKTGTKVTHKVAYGGNVMPLFHIGFGPDDVLYGSSILPIHFVKIDVARHHIEQIGNLGGGEVFSMLDHDGRLLMGAYSGMAPLMSYQPGAPFHPSADAGNPLLVSSKGVDSAWRPQALITGPDNRVYVGAMAGYGQLEEPLISWDTTSNTVALHGGIARDQSVISLTTWKDFVVGGTSIQGGGGSHATQKEASLFLWNTKTEKMEFTVVPVPGAAMITDVIAAPNGLVYGIADDVLFVFDPEGRKVILNQKLPFAMPVGRVSFAPVAYNSVALDAGGQIWGLAEDGIFRIDTKANQVKLVARAPEKITGGFALHRGAIYFLCGASVYRYALPGPVRRPTGLKSR